MITNNSDNDNNNNDDDDDGNDVNYNDNNGNTVSYRVIVNKINKHTLIDRYRYRHTNAHTYAVT